jgi:predicted TIM-barrel fold metal-dependent hydrolase
MVIDFHTHIFPKAIRNNREKYFPFEPAFKLLYSSPNSKLVGAKEFVSSMNEQGVDKSVVFGFPWTDLELIKTHNDYIMESVAKYPQHLIGFCCLDPFCSGAAKEVLRCVDGGLSGLGELAFYLSGIDEEALKQLNPLMEICQKKDFPVLIHTNEPVGHDYPGKTSNTLKEIYDLINRFPNNTIVLAHWGGGLFFYNLLKKNVKDSFKNIYFDTAASPFLYDVNIYKYAKEIVGLEKILFGSDFPLLQPQRYFTELEQSGLSKDDIDSICGRNAAKVLKL